MSLYNLKHDGDQYRVTKFDDDLNVESSYLMTATECTCPAGHRPTCRHRQMFSTLVQRIGSSWMFDFDKIEWVGGVAGEDTVRSTEDTASLLPAPRLVDEVAVSDIKPLPPGIYTTSMPDDNGVAIIAEGEFAGREIKFPRNELALDPDHDSPTHIHLPHPAWRRI